MKALFSLELVENGFGNQSQVAEVMTVTKSSVSMAIAIVEMVGVDLVRTIGPAHAIGRPRWDALSKAIEAKSADRADLIRVAEQVYTEAEVNAVIDGTTLPEGSDVSVRAFEAVAKVLDKMGGNNPPATALPRMKTRSQPLTIAGKRSGTLKRTSKGVAIELSDGDFADWVEAEAQEFLNDLHARWLRRTED
jgi:ParB family chromosome partitioning protein